MIGLLSKFTKFRCPSCDAPISFAEAERTFTIPWFFNFRRNAAHLCSSCSKRLKLFSRLPAWKLFLSIWIVLGVQAAGSFGIMFVFLPLINGFGPGLGLIAFILCALILAAVICLFWLWSTGMFMRKTTILEKIE